MSSSLAFGNQQNPQGAFSFGSATSSSAPSLTAPTAGISTNPLASSTPFGGFGGTSTATTNVFGAPTATTNVFGAPTATTNVFGTPAATTNVFGTPAATTNLFGTSSATTNLFGTTQTAPSFSTSLFPTSTTTTPAFPSIAGAPTTSAAAPPFNFSGFNTSTPSSTFSFGGGSLLSAPTATTSTVTSTVGLGGVDIQTSTGLNGVNTSNKKDNKAIKESQIPNELAITVESFKKYVKEQKAIREEMGRVSSKNIFRVQEQVNALKQQLSVVSNGLQRNAVAIAKLKEESNNELKNAEIAQRTKDAPHSMQYENNAPAEYFENLANNFEKQMQSYRQQIEQLERHLISLTQPYTLTPNEWTAIRRRLHDTFVTLAAQLQTVHQQVQIYKEYFINQEKLSHADLRSICNRKDNFNSISNSHLPENVTYGPSPFASVQSAVGKAISSALHRSQQLPGLTSGNLSSSFSMTRMPSFQTTTTFKPLGQTGVPSFGSSSLGDATGFASDSTAQSQFALNSQKTFQLQKPPAGNKRGKRYTST